MKLSLEGKQKELYMKTIVWKTIVSLIKERKNIDISARLVSIRISSYIIIVKTKTPLVSGEILLLEDEIKKKLSSPFWSVGEDIVNYSFKLL